MKPDVANDAMDSWNDEAIRLTKAKQVMLDKWQRLPQDLSRDIANRYAAPRPFPSSTSMSLPFPLPSDTSATRSTIDDGDDTDDQVRQTLAALRMLPESVARIHGVFGRIVYDFQQRIFPTRQNPPPESTSDDDDSSSSSSSSSSDSDSQEDDEDVNLS
jgi:hypothetical protein